MKLKKILYQIRNWKAHWRAFWQGNAVALAGGRIVVRGELHAKKISADGAELDLGCVARRSVTTAGVNYLRDDFAAAAGGADITNFKYHASGTGTNAEAIGDTALQTEVTDNARTAGTQDNSVTKQYKTVNTISYTAPHAITEHGLFSASTVGTLWDRSVFSVINVGTGDSIQFTYILSITDGG